MSRHSNSFTTTFFYLLLCSFLFFPGFSDAAPVMFHHGMVVKTTATGVNPTTKLLTTGKLSLLRHVAPGPAVPFEESYAPDTAQQILWFLLKEDTGQTVEVTRFNYKSVMKLLLTNRPDLINKLGQKGYRFKDITSIVEEYNGK